MAETAPTADAEVVKPKDLTESDVKPVVAKQTNVPFRALFRFASTGDLVLLVVACLCAVVAGIVMPLFTVILGDLFNALNDPNNFEAGINQVCSRLAGLALGTGVVQYLTVGLSALSAVRQVSRLRSSYMAALLRQDAEWHDQGRSGEAATRMAADTVTFEGAIGIKLTMVIQAAATFLAGIIIAFVQGWRMALVILCFVPVFTVLGTFAGKMLGGSAKDGGDAYARAGAIANESLSALRTIASFGSERAEVARYDKALAKCEASGISRGFYSGIGIGLLMFTMFAVYGVGLYWGGRLVLMSREDDPLCAFDPNRSGCFTGGRVLNVIFALLIGAGGLGQGGPAGATIVEAMGAAFGMYAVIDRVPPIDTAREDGLKPAPATVTGRIEFKNVCFTYPSRPSDPILCDFNLVVEAGKTLALVGGSGSGKSTIVALIQRQYDPNSGVVTLDGVDIREYNVQALRALQSIVSQEPQLFAMSVRENIALGAAGTANATPSDEEVTAAARSANADGFISALPQGYGTLITSGQLSGGQKQRIAIARAIIRDPAILLLDEATSALDSTTERVIQRDLDRLLAAKKAGGKGHTAVMIAHRLSTVTRADRIVVLEKGVIIESGSHPELMARDDSAYRRLRELQRVQDDEVGLDDSELPTETAAAGMKSTAGAASTSMAASSKSAAEAAEAEDAAAFAAAMALPAVPFSRLLRYTYPDLGWLVGMFFASAIMGCTFPIMSILLSTMTATFYEPDNTVLLNKVTWYMIYFFIIAGGCLVSAFFQFLTMGVVSQRLLRRVRRDLYEAVLRKPVGWHDVPANSVGRLTARLATDTALLSSVIGMVRPLRALMAHAPTLTTPLSPQSAAQNVQNLCQLIVGLVIAFNASWRITLVILAVAPLMALGGALQIKFFKGFEEASQKEFAECGSVAAEAMTSSRTVSAFGLQTVVGARFNVALKKPTSSSSKAALVSGIGASFNNALMIACYALAFWSGSLFIKDGKMTFQELMTSFFAVTFAAMGIGNASGMAVDAAKAAAARRSIFALIDEPSPIDAYSAGGIVPASAPSTGPADSTQVSVGLAAPESEGKRGLVFDNVTFSYPARASNQVLRGLSFTIHRGTTVAIVGPSGSGKSTIIQLLQRFYDPDSGTVSMDGVDLKAWNVHSLRSTMGWVQQEAPLFADSISYNIAYGMVRTEDKLAPDASVRPDAGKDATVPVGFSAPAHVQQAAKTANALDFVTAFSHGMATFAGERGSQLSGGQKQRIAIARAIIRDPEILLLDEATSALDSESERIVQASIDALLEQGGRSKRTTIIIAHRLSTIKKADEIIVVDKGVVTERGTHEQLMQSGASGESAGVYRRMVLEQDAGLSRVATSSNIAAAASS